MSRMQPCYLSRLGTCMFMKTRAISLDDCKLRFKCFGGASASDNVFRKAHQLSKAVKCELTESKCL